MRLTISKFSIPVLCLISMLIFTAIASGGELADLHKFEGKTVTSLEIVGAKVTRQHVIEREIRTQIDQAFSSKTFRDDIQRLLNLDIFSSIKPVIKDSGNGLSLELLVKEIPFIVAYPSYDYTEENGWSFGPSMKAANLFGQDIFANGYALFGSKSTYFLNLVNPWITGNHVSMDLTTARIVRENELDEFQETALELTPWLGMYLGDKGRLKFSASFFQMKSDIAGHTLSADNTDNMFRVGFGLGYDSRDSWTNPHQGWWHEVEVIQTGGFLPGDGDFMTTNIDLQRYQPSIANHTIVVSELLTLQSGQVGRDLPEYMDFHLGGSNSIRGYDITESGRDLYGKNQWLSTIEYRFDVLPVREYSLLGFSAAVGLGGAFFTDTGLAWNDNDDFKLERARTGFGFGLRLLLPMVEMSRFDVGIDDGGNFLFHFAAWSKMKAQRYRLR